MTVILSGMTFTPSSAASLPEGSAGREDSYGQRVVDHFFGKTHRPYEEAGLWGRSVTAFMSSGPCSKWAATSRL